MSVLRLQRPLKALFFLPTRCSDLRRRTSQICRMLMCLRTSLQGATALLRSWTVHLDVNGCGPDDGRRAAERAAAFSHSVLGLLPSCSHTQEPGKVRAINRGLEIARALQVDVFVCVDNDIVFTSYALAELLASYCTRGTQGGVTAFKMPLVDRHSTRFQRLNSHFYEVLVELGVAPPRATGSLYAIDPFRISEFPVTCNEGDFLDSLGLDRSPVVVRSELSRDFAAEVARRVRLLRASRSIAFHRWNDDLECIHSLLRRAERSEGFLRDVSFRTSLNAYQKLLEHVDATYQLSEGEK
jgi:hypothetical protein